MSAAYRTRNTAQSGTPAPCGFSARSGRTGFCVAQLSGDSSEVVLTFAFADIVDRPGIDLRTREMLTVTALTAMGTASSQLELHIRAALNVGVTREEIADIIIQMAVNADVHERRLGSEAGIRNL